uniref:Uncharacterized protein n=1 Tax=Ananas comosus var. bracteatus TaxID=296719 RepID=A0A6V7PP57_ANACO|nr:unnamed protein product [Ananas comosus var. bracteatus]
MLPTSLKAPIKAQNALGLRIIPPRSSYPSFQASPMVEVAPGSIKEQKELPSLASPPPEAVAAAFPGAQQPTPPIAASLRAAAAAALVNLQSPQICSGSKVKPSLPLALPLPGSAARLPSASGSPQLSSLSSSRPPWPQLSLDPSPSSCGLSFEFVIIFSAIRGCPDASGGEHGDR